MPQMGERYCGRKIKVELVLLSELSKWSWKAIEEVWLIIVLMKVSRTSARNSRYLKEPYRKITGDILSTCWTPNPKITCDSLRTNIFWFTSELITVLTRQLLTTCGQRMLPAISVNKAYCCHKAIGHCSHHQHCTQMGFRVEKNRILTIDS